MSLHRRRLLQGSAAALAAGLLPAGCGEARNEAQSPIAFRAGEPLPWINWAGNQHCIPAHRVAPASEAEVLELMRSARGTIRALGSGHSFSALVPTDDTLVATDLLAGLAAYDAATLQAEVLAGTRIRDLGPMLAAIGQSLPNQPDIDYVAIGGAIATSAHATGPRWGSLSAHVAGLSLATPDGELIECSAQTRPELFAAARCSLGALGIVTRIRLQNVAALQLTEVNRAERTEDVLDDLPRRMAAHRHFEFMPLPHSDWCLSVSTDEAQPGDTNIGEDDLQAVYRIRSLFESIAWLPGADRVYSFLLQRALGPDANTVRTGPSHVVLPHPRLVRFREMEYTVPADAGPDCLREILRTIRTRNVPVCFPLEYRQTAADDIWLSMFGEREGASISVHQFGDTDYRPYFDVVEPIFRKYDGRPHWGKLHTQDSQSLASLYPRWRDFMQLRRELDPAGRMLNDHLKRVLDT